MKILNTTFLIKSITVLLFCFATTFASCQNEDDINIQTDFIENKENKNYNRKSLICAFDVFRLIPTGNNYAGRSTEGKVSFNLKFALVYKGVFAGLVSQTSYLDITNPEETGFYDKSTISGTGLMLGYEYSPFSDFNVSLSFALFGKARYQNTHFSNGDEAEFTDRAKMNLYEMNVDYIVSDSFSFYFYYGFRTDKLLIQVPQEIEQNFNKANFHNIGFGLKFRFSSILHRIFR